MLKIMLVDDHAVLRMGLEAVFSIQDDVSVVASVGTGEEALQIASRGGVDVCIVDLRLGEGMDGVSFIAALRGIDEAIRPKAVVFSTFDSEEDVFRAIEAGAYGYLSKQSSGAELLDAVRRAASGESCVPPEIAEKLRQRDAHRPLSARQLEILSYLAVGLSNKEIGQRVFVCEDTVKTHLRTIYKRLGAKDRVEALRIAAERGIVRLG